MVVGTDIFLCGGHMDIDQGEWATRVLMKFCPNTMEVSGLLRGNIYVVGGFDGVAPRNTAEVFRPGTGR